MNLIFVIALSVAFVAVATPLDLNEDIIKLIKQHDEFCTKENHLSDKEIAKLKVKDFSSPSDNLKCFINCTLEKIGALKNGVIQEDHVLHVFGPLIGEETIRKIISKCGHLKGKSDCDTAFKLHECLEKLKHDASI
ncbi:general odorant-binding protein 56a [Drosophila grimshawi]|uniref:GH23016 n=1 Tax=Drosophila grimshawi TaxID=7222 RepID=B4JWC9_DROGR|nr:general odorant-binding protein 56a [Drosophila grimshawi]EDV98267.1 GH23016 [Drosophila grimshawi]